MMMFPHTITLYHKEKDGWSRHLIEHVLWDDLRGRVMRTQGVESADKAIVYIPAVINGVLRDVPIADGDVIYRGEYDKEVVKSTKELENVLFVTSVAWHNFGDDMANWVVTAR